jgi:hypothetical protein
MKRYGKPQPADVESIRRLAPHWIVPEIAALLGFSHGTVRQYAHRYGIPLLTSAAGKAQARNLWRRMWGAAKRPPADNVNWTS